MTDDKPTRRDLMKPIQLLGLAFGAALFTGIVTLVSMGFFQQHTAEQTGKAAVVAAVVAGIAFIAVLLIVSLLLLASTPLRCASRSIARCCWTTKTGDDAKPDAAASGDPKA